MYTLEKTRSEYLKPYFEKNLKNFYFETSNLPFLRGNWTVLISTPQALLREVEARQKSNAETTQGVLDLAAPRFKLDSTDIRTTEHQYLKKMIQEKSKVDAKKLDEIFGLLVMDRSSLEHIDIYAKDMQTMIYYQAEQNLIDLEEVLNYPTKKLILLKNINSGNSFILVYNSIGQYQLLANLDWYQDFTKDDDPDEAFMHFDSLYRFMQELHIINRISQDILISDDRYLLIRSIGDNNFDLADMKEKEQYQIRHSVLHTGETLPEFLKRYIKEHKYYTVEPL